MVWHHSGLVLQRFLVTVVSYHSDLTAVSHHWSLITVASYHSGLSSQRFLMTVVTYPSGLSSQWFLITVVTHPRVLSSQWSLVTTSGAPLYISVLTHLHSTKTHLFLTGDHQRSNSGQPDGSSEEDEQHHRIQRPPLQCQPMHERRRLHPHPEQR